MELLTGPHADTTEQFQAHGFQWTARCDDRRQWAIFIGADDTAQIRYCNDVEKAGLPACDITKLDTRDETEVKDSADA